MVLEKQLIIEISHDILSKNVQILFRQCSECSDSVQNAQILFRLFRQCSECSESVQNFQAMFRMFRICSEFSVNVKNVQNLFRIFCQCSECSECSESVQNFQSMFSSECSESVQTFSEFLAQKLVYSEFPDIVGLIRQLTLIRNNILCRLNIFNIISFCYNRKIKRFANIHQ